MLPLERFSTGLRRVIAPIGFAYSQISNLIIAPGCDGKAVFAAILEAAAKTAPADNFLFPKVREACHLAKAMPADHHRTGETTAAPIVGLDTFPDYPSYLQTVRTKTRKNIRNMRNRLERVAPLVHHIASSAADTKGVIARTLAWRTERLHEQGLTSRAFSTSHFALFCDSLVGHPHMRLAAFSLRHGDNPLAEQWGFVHADRYYCYVTSRDGSHLEESPGKLHLAEIIRSSMDMNLSACDLGVPDMPYKQTWATHTVQIADCALPLTLKGKMICQIWDVFLRPILKRWILSAPKPIRAALLGLVGRAV